VLEQGISAQIMSTDYTGYVIELQTVDAQASHVGGVLILVTGSFTTPVAVKKKFTQSFFLAPQGNGAYFVLNDMFRFVSEMPSTVINEVLANHVNESTQRATSPSESGMEYAFKFIFFRNKLQQGNLLVWHIQISTLTFQCLARNSFSSS
jgi:hypothetical protein